ncbi:uncharacterized protein YlxP (DUF503 family) [Allocatelliglobosispora scoriae]|uniref:Uncharacterized protein YlxP (DUF503 family) n=1 Tax=Allocatelliglobosispora scoriae TaxID=643052 RepID=A0A841BXN1_9ACTN|nr:DUF503 domain-containing protein [Allocatelliglobosispora scoriae]MBB5872286.1 uncharacterized protein YlxP (DUF503 family) [Allocatelliglobosispora scoriae]
MFLGSIVFDVLLPGDSRSLKEKRSYLRPVIAALKKFEVSAAEVGDQDRHGRAQLAVAVVASEAVHVREVLDRCERLVAGRPELELLSVKTRLISGEDLD